MSLRISLLFCAKDSTSESVFRCYTAWKAIWWPRSSSSFINRANPHLAKKGNLVLSRPSEIRHKVNSPGFGLASSQVVSNPAYCFLRAAFTAVLNLPSGLKNNSTVRLTCSDKWLMSLERDGIFAKYNVRSFICMRSQNSNFDCPPPK